MLKLLALLVMLSYTSLLAYEISIDSSSDIAEERADRKYTFKRDAQKKVVIDIESKLMWQDDSFAKSVKKSLVDAKQYCYNLTLASFTNWRLPSIKELQSIADISHSNPAIHKEFKNVISDYYISASPRLSDIDTILYMDFNQGHKYKGSRRGRGYIRCVRVHKQKHQKDNKFIK